MKRYSVSLIFNQQKKDLGETEAMDKDEAKSVIRNEFRIPKDWILEVEEVTE